MWRVDRSKRPRRIRKEDERISRYRTGWGASVTADSPDSAADITYWGTHTRCSQHSADMAWERRELEFLRSIANRRHH